ncbi:Crp/Fnr family transcriptional regulator [Flavobacterium cheonhonense]|jgi:CRP-like cAMP-binding protein|uniref:Crp/Fnr family transcriptional regulator n=1 Tax=Flavobacterium cheonhonense TaxID=706185 RepID=A0ABP7TKE2_9FLAO|nr:Crp/Fnr family transcriptional regulator [Flavobacterium cheonhonense]
MYTSLQKFLLSKAPVSSDALETICSCFESLKTKRNQIVLSYDEVAGYYYFVNKGAVRLFTITPDGQELSRYFAFEDTFVTALPSFIDQKPAKEYLQTIEPSELLRIKREDFYRLVRTEPVFAAIYTEILEMGFIVAQERIYGFQGYDVLSKVRWIIQNQPKLLLRVSNKIVASYLGISPSTLSRIKSKL